MSRWVAPDLSFMLGKVEEHVALTYGQWEPDRLRAMVASLRGVFDEYRVNVSRRERAEHCPAELGGLMAPETERAREDRAALGATAEPGPGNVAFDVLLAQHGVYLDALNEIACDQGNAGKRACQALGIPFPQPVYPAVPVAPSEENEK